MLSSIKLNLFPVSKHIIYLPYIHPLRHFLMTRLQGVCRITIRVKRIIDDAETVIEI